MVRFHPPAPFLGVVMFKCLMRWLEKYTESKATSVPKYLSGKNRESGAELNNISRTKNMKHEDLLK